MEARPRRPGDNVGDVHEREDVDGDAELAHVPRPVNDGTRIADFTQQEVGDGNEVGDVESDCRKRDERVEGGGGADVDEGEKGVDAGN